MKIIYIAVLLLSNICFGIASDLPESFAELVNKVSPAVVNISTTQKISNGGGPMGAYPPGSPFEEFNDLFERFGLTPRFDGGNEEYKAPMSLGSGFVIDPTGYIVTNHHVIENAEEVTVSFSDETQYEAEIVGSDAKTDLALLKIKGSKKFPHVSFAENDDNAKVGDWIIAIGNPFGLGGTVTKGIISARARDINAGLFDDFIQTDAAINSGNSGGPMFNLKGDVIGINTAILSPSGGNIGIGFATPSSLAKPIISQIKEHGKVIRGYLGVTFQPVTKEIAKSIGLAKEIGAMVADVEKSGPADVAGIKSGDVIVKFDSKEIKKSRYLPKIIAMSQIGKTYSIEIYRKGSYKNLSVKLAEYPDNSKDLKYKPKGSSDGQNNNIEEVLEMSAVTIDRNVRAQFNIPQDVEGALVLKVKRSGKAGRANIMRGDIILEADQRKVMSVEEIQAIVADAIKEDKTSILFLINRRGQKEYLAVTIKSENKKK